MKKKEKEIKTSEPITELQDFPIDIKRDIIDILNDTPTIVKLGDGVFRIQNMRYYSLYRICRLALDMRQADENLDDDNKILTALCTDLDAMCEIVAIILCNHLFTPEGNMTDEEGKSRNDHYVSVMKMKVMNSTFEVNQWAGIVLAAIKSIDLSGFFLLKKSVSMLTDSLLTRKKKSMETASLFTEAQSLRMQPTS